MSTPVTVQKSSPRPTGRKGACALSMLAATGGEITLGDPPKITQSGILHAGEPMTSTQAHQAAMAGLKAGGIPAVATRLGMGPEELAQKIGISRSTYHRKMQTPEVRLSPQESDVLLRYGMLAEKAIGTFDGDDDAARQWLQSPQPGLGGTIPLDFAQTTMGFGEVEKLLTRIDLGVYA